MMIDNVLHVSQKQDLAQVAGNYLSNGNGTTGGSIDLGAVGTVPQTGTSPQGDVGFGMPVSCIGTVTTAFTSAASTATVQMQVVTATDEALTGTLTVLAETAAIVCPAVGYQFAIRTLPKTCTQRYLGIRWVIAVQTTTAGKASAFFASDIQNNP